MLSALSRSRTAWAGLALTCSTATVVGMYHPNAEEAYHLAQTVPRTGRFLAWAAGCMYRYHTQVDVSDTSCVSEFHRACAGELREVCRANGGIYVKAAQFACNLATVPPEYRDALSKLLDDCRPVDFAVVRSVIEGDTGRPLWSVYSTLSETPVAAASLAQVHRGTLPDGREVAVKVQYPAIAASATADLNVLALATTVLSVLGSRHTAAFQRVFQDLAARIRQETDFRHEVTNSELLRGQLSGSAHSASVAVPECIPGLTTARVHTMEWVEGVRIDDAVELQRRGVDLRAVGNAFLSAFADMVYVHGLLHGDLHAGNVLVRGAGEAFQVVILDHGWYVRVPDAMRLQYCKLWCAFVLGDAETAEAVAREMAGPDRADVVPAVLAMGLRRGAPAGSGGQSGALSLAEAMAHMPPAITEILRASQGVRTIGAALGCFAPERLQVNARFAVKGLGLGAGGERGLVGGGRGERLRRRWEEWKMSTNLAARIRLLRLVLWWKGLGKAVVGRLQTLTGSDRMPVQ